MQQVITAIEQATPAWLTGILRQGGHLPTGAVQSLAVTRIFTEQLASISYFFTPAYSTDAPAAAPTRLFLKIPRSEAESRLVASVGEREVRMYQVLSPLRFWMAGLPEDFWTLFLVRPLAAFRELACDEVLLERGD